jgi:SpoVK/Ycf46/Vps4 family AAA+-type ATPase
MAHYNSRHLLLRSQQLAGPPIREQWLRPEALDLSMTNPTEQGTSMSFEHVNVFELEMELPAAHLTDLAERLVGFQPRYSKLKKHLQLLMDLDGLEVWSKKHYRKRVPLLDALGDRYPLVVLYGDVGTGKTATAEAIANAMARDLKKDATLFKLSNRVRGSGNVGEMSMLINRAFEIVMRAAGKAKSAFLIIDEGDSLAASRNNQQSHHEDKVAVNTLIQKIDDARRSGGRVLVFLCTNRFVSLDPAIVRRAGHTEEFRRPTDQEREELFRMDCRELGIHEATLKELVHLTGAHPSGRLGFTFSDIRTRLLPEALGKAFPDRKLTAADLLEAARSVAPTPSIAEA